LKIRAIENITCMDAVFFTIWDEGMVFTNFVSRVNIFENIGVFIVQ